LSANSLKSGYTGVKSDYVLEDNDKEPNTSTDSNTDKTCNCQGLVDHQIKHNHPFYYCKEHPKFQNISLKSISHHLELSTDHRQEIIIVGKEKQTVSGKAKFFFIIQNSNFDFFN
jgi:hypothetical protein